MPAFRILSLPTRRGSIDLSASQAGDSPAANLITVLTGPNGSGKTEVLCSLVQQMRAELGAKVAKLSVDQARANTLGVPRRIVAQTFSPFSRFPKPLTSTTFDDVKWRNAEDAEPYRPVGFRRGLGYAAERLSRNVVEQSLRALANEEGREVDISHALEYLGFSRTMDLEFRAADSSANKLLRSTSRSQVEQWLSDFQERIRVIEMRYSTSQALMLRRIERMGLNALSAEIHQASSVLRKANEGDKTYRLALRFTSDSFGKANELLRAVLQLSQIGLMRLRFCRLTPLVGKGKVEIAQASSGQQQLLCSLLGIVGQARSSSLVVIDEPELSLHPQWQMDYLDLLNRAMSPFEGCHIVVATHSALIVQRAAQLAIPIVPLSPLENPLGHTNQDKFSASVEATLFELLNTRIESSTYLANRIFSAVTEAIDEPNSAARHLSELRRLAAMYEKTSSSKTTKLIQDGINLIEEVRGERNGG